MIKCIDLREDIIEIDGKVLKFPMSLEEVEAVLGKPDEEVPEGERYVNYIYHEAGIVFESIVNDMKWFKCRKVYIDEAHNITVIRLYCGDVVRPKISEIALPHKTCKAKITKMGRNLWFISDRTETDSLRIMRWPSSGYKPNGEAESIVDPLTVSYDPKKPHGDVSYKIKKCKEEVLEFDNFNFKLAIIQVLMYELEVLEPYFDIYDFAEQYEGKEIDTESTKAPRPVVNFFTKLPIPKRLAEQVLEIDMDGGNEIYANIIPQWDGEDEYFDLNSITEKELKQFPNLKKATIMSGKYEEVSEVFKGMGIEVDRI